MLAKSSSQLRFAQALLVYSYRMKYGRRSNDGPQMHESCQIFGLLDSQDQLMLPVTMSDDRGSTGMGRHVLLWKSIYVGIDAGTPSS